MGKESVTEKNVFLAEKGRRKVALFHFLVALEAVRSVEQRR